MANRLSVRAFHKPLQDAGLVPPNTRLMDLVIGVDGAVAVTYEAYLDVEQIERLGQILIDVARQNQERGNRSGEP